MIEDFIFQNTTKVYFGKNQLQHLGEEVSNFGKKVLLVYGGGSIKRNGLYDRIMEQLKASGIEVFELSGVEPNPRHTTVNKGAEICRKEGIDAIIAVGGGSTIDCSKGISGLVMSDGKNDIWELIESGTPLMKGLPILVVLTMAATGSEMDAGAVISNMEINQKHAIGGPGVRPRVAFEDPTNTFTVPAYQTACGSFDIMSHIFDVEYFSKADTMDMLKRIQEEVLNTVIKYAPVAVKEPDNYEARANLMWASSWALNDFLYDGCSQDTVCHEMEHELSAHYDITHGHGLAIITPRWLEYILDDSTAADIARFGRRCFGVDDQLSDMDAAKAAIEALSDFCFNKLGLKSNLSDLGIDASKFDIMAESACRGGVLNSIKPLNKQDIVEIYKMCL